MYGMKMKFCPINSRKSEEKYYWEKGKFAFSRALNNWTLSKGVKCENGKKKLRGNWWFDLEKGTIAMKLMKGVQKCHDAECSRKSSISRNVFKSCGKCERVFYCSKKHQKRDWKVHKFECFFY